MPSYLFYLHSQLSEPLNRRWQMKVLQPKVQHFYRFSPASINIGMWIYDRRLLFIRDISLGLENSLQVLPSGIFSRQQTSITLRNSLVDFLKCKIHYWLREHYPLNSRIQSFIHINQALLSFSFCYHLLFVNLLFKEYDSNFIGKLFDSYQIFVGYLLAVNDFPFLFPLHHSWNLKALGHYIFYWRRRRLTKALRFYWLHLRSSRMDSLGTCCMRAID